MLIAGAASVGFPGDAGTLNPARPGEGEGERGKRGPTVALADADVASGGGLLMRVGRFRTRDGDVSPAPASQPVSAQSAASPARAVVGQSVVRPARTVSSQSATSPALRSSPPLVALSASSVLAVAVARFAKGADQSERARRAQGRRYRAFGPPRTRRRNDPRDVLKSSRSILQRAHRKEEKTGRAPAGADTEWRSGTEAEVETGRGRGDGLWARPGADSMLRVTEVEVDRVRLQG
eukprot:6100726-Pyramimonas_sp.AAC.3